MMGAFIANCSFQKFRQYTFTVAARALSVCLNLLSEAVVVDMVLYNEPTHSVATASGSLLNDTSYSQNRDQSSVVGQREHKCIVR